MAVSKFKATCLSVLQRVQKTRKPILITRFGKPIAEMVPPPPPPRTANWMGSMAGTCEILVISSGPRLPTEEWNVFRNETTSGHSRFHLERPPIPNDSAEGPPRSCRIRVMNYGFHPSAPGRSWFSAARDG